MNRPRLFLITPPAFDLAKLAADLGDAFKGGDIACVLIYMPDADGKVLQEAAQVLVPVIQDGGAAALIYRDTQVTGRSGADGVHIDTSLEDVKLAVESLQPAKIVGGGGTKLKHQDMEWAETGIPEPATPIDMTSADFVPKLKELLTGNPGRTVGFICRTGNRSNYLTEVLEKAGLTNIVDVTGGVAGNGKVTGWIAEGLPMKQHCETC